MKVKELIKKLREFNQDSDVLYYVEECDYERMIGDVEEREVEVRYDKKARKSIMEKCVVLYEGNGDEDEEAYWEEQDKS